MKKDFRKNNGAVFIVVILVVIIASAGGFAAFLGIRMAVTGDSFLAPLEEWGWIEAGENKKQKASNENDNDDKNENTKISNSTHYQMRLGGLVNLGMQVSLYGSFTSDNLMDNTLENLSNLETVNDLILVDLYAKENEIDEVDVTIDLEPFLKEIYDIAEKDSSMKENFKSRNINSYEDFVEVFFGNKDSLEDILDEDVVLDYILDEVYLDQIGITRKELKKNLTLKVDGNYAEIKINFSDDMNDTMWEFVEENKDYLEENLVDLFENEYEYYPSAKKIPDIVKNFKVSKKTYVKDFITLYNETIEWLIELYEDSNEDSEYMDMYINAYSLIKFEEVK